MKTTILLLALVLVACTEPKLTAITVPPTGKQAVLDSYENTLTISKGVAIGFSCSDQGPCQEASATVDDGNLAAVYPAYLDDLEANYDNGRYSGQVAATGFVLVAKTEGRTILRVNAADDAVTEYEVEIVK